MACALCAAPALPRASPFTAQRSNGNCSVRQAPGRRLVLAAAAQRQQQRLGAASSSPGSASSSPGSASSSPASAPTLAVSTTAAALASGLGLRPAAVAATLAADPQAAAAAQAVADIAALDSATAGALSAVLKPLLSLASLLMIVRIVMSWYPELDGKQMPWAIAFNPTEPLLAATRKVVPPFNGLDVSPIVWVALLSFLNEILTGPQGILSLIARKAI